MRSWVTFALLLLGVPTGHHAEAQSKLPSELSQYLKEQGPIAKRGVLSRSDSQKQLILYYCVDQNARGGRNEGAINSKNYYCEIALFNRSNDAWIFANREALGHGTVLAFSDDGVVTVTSVTYSAADALCCPSRRRTVKFATITGNLVPVR